MDRKNVRPLTEWPEEYSRKFRSPLGGNRRHRVTERKIEKRYFAPPQKPRRSVEWGTIFGAILFIGPGIFVIIIGIIEGIKSYLGYR